MVMKTDRILVVVMVVVVAAVLVLQHADAAAAGEGAAASETFPKSASRLSRSVSPSDASNAAGTGDLGEQKVCHSTTPCGWAVYVPFTRRVDYFMKNTCECPKDRECLRTDDDLSVSAYVYRCRTADQQDKQTDS